MIPALFTAPYWQIVYFGNTLKDYTLALVVFAASLLVLKIFQGIILLRLETLAKKTKTDIDDTLIKIVRSVRPPFYFFVAFYLGFKSLIVPALLERATNIVLVVWVVAQAIIALQILLDFLVRKYVGREEEPGTKEAVKLLSRVTKGVLWAIGLLFVLSNLGINVTSLVAGLGIGGVAVALALQNILGDLFSSFAIFFDKPFVVGDFIVVGEHMGTVKKIGIKTTRITALQGEEIIIPNNELTSARIQNFKRMKERRLVFRFGVTYDTPVAKLKKIPGMIKKIIQGTRLTRFDRTHFVEFGDSSLNFEVAYYVKSPEYNKARDIHQKIHLAIMEQFEKEGIEMAFPTRTIYLEKS